MKKKILLATLCFCVMLLSFGCGNNTLSLVKNNMAEWTKVYYYGENEDFYCTLSSGERESEYVLNGACDKTVPYALLSLTFFGESKGYLIKADVTIGDEEKTCELEINSLNHTYMVDLEQSFDGTETIKVTYEGKTCDLSPISNDFNINHEKALEIACEKLEDKITEKKSFNHLNAECYLRVLDQKANNFDGFFWCFTVLNVDNKNYSIIISTEDGSVLAKSN